MVQQDQPLQPETTGAGTGKLSAPHQTIHIFFSRIQDNAAFPWEHGGEAGPVQKQDVNLKRAAHICPACYLNGCLSCSCFISIINCCQNYRLMSWLFSRSVGTKKLMAKKSEERLRCCRVPCCPLESVALCLWDISAAKLSLEGKNCSPPTKS